MTALAAHGIVPTDVHAELHATAHASSQLIRELRTLIRRAERVRDLAHRLARRKGITADDAFAAMIADVREGEASDAMRLASWDF
jgi:hypothetical protein